MRKILMAVGAALSLAACDSNSGPGLPQPGAANQGAGWTPTERAEFYSLDQGSQIILASWMMALTHADGSPFMGDKLARYGYLPNGEDTTTMLPVGFTAAGPPGAEMIGMTCAACHTRDITVGAHTYRVDGGPAFADFQSFLADLDQAVKTMLGDKAASARFTDAVLGTQASGPQRAKLLDDVRRWYHRYHTMMAGSLPPEPWGPGRLDAVAMIFNRVTGLDIGTGITKDGMIPQNIRVADAPTRYPFLWNAAIQDKTQWPGFAPNGNDFFGLFRNLGEVYGVFANFHPFLDKNVVGSVNYVSTNSANFAGLLRLEDLIKKLGPPAYPWKVDEKLAKTTGASLFQSNCASCHGVTMNQPLLGPPTWQTPLKNVGTDTREARLLDRCADSGVLGKARSTGLKKTDTAINILKVSVINSILQAPWRPLLPSEVQSGTVSSVAAPAPEVVALKPAPSAAGCQEPSPTDPVDAKYEARVLYGIWAAAPYLHNGSVPTLADLLTPAAERPAQFAVGPEYDPARVGLAAVQPNSTYVLRTTDCSDINSGNSRCGHEYGTDLSPADKRALLEYLKQL